MNLQKKLRSRILALPEVGAEGDAFATLTREFARFRDEQAIAVRLTKERIKVLKPDYRLEVGFPPRDWLIVHFDEEADLEFVMKLVEEASRLN